jgi:DNA-damage-inducible protein J
MTMGSHSSMLHVRIDDEVKAKAIAALEAMGLSASDAVRLLFHRIAADQAFPLELKVPNAETRAAMEEAEEIIRSGKLRFRDAAKLFADLDNSER